MAAHISAMQLFHWIFKVRPGLRTPLFIGLKEEWDTHEVIMPTKRPKRITSAARGVRRKDGP